VESRKEEEEEEEMLYISVLHNLYVFRYEMGRKKIF
jgi:hypothetical protein